MIALLLAIIYIAFISLGLPDSLLGSAWPVMHSGLNVPLSYMGALSMIIAGGTIISSLMSDFMTKKLRTGLVTAISVFMTAAALFGFSISNSFVLLCLWAIPYGLGAGAVDAALNNYVALHFASRHMSWLHCFWGVGAGISPYIMGYYLTNGGNWHGGYRAVSIIQVVLTVILFMSLPLWNKGRSADERPQSSAASVGIKDALKIKGVLFVLVTFFCYSAVESTTGLWASSYLCEYKGVPEETAARFASLFFLGITFGRFVCGFVSDKFGDRQLIRIGLGIIIMGVTMIICSFNFNVPALLGLVVIGIGCAPIYPSIIHAAPSNFGRDNSQLVIGIQMASAYVGTTFMPSVFGVIAEKIGLGIFPLYLLLFTALMTVMSEMLNKSVGRNLLNS